MKLTILGCHSATPRADLYTTAQVLEIQNKHFLIDCGEGTQKQLRKHKISFSRIEHVFISHLHGDHVYGLIGFISSMGLLNREKDLHIYGPLGIKELIETQLRLSESRLNFKLHFKELNTTEPVCIYEDKKLTVETIPLKHRIYTNGFLFKEKPGKRKLLIEKVEKHNIDLAYYHRIKEGKDVILEDGTRIPNEKLTAPPPPPKSYAFCSDTVFKPDIVPQITGVNVLYHEATFLEDNRQLSKLTFHSTAKQAAEIAKMAKVNQLILGHFSGRYKNLEDFKKEAQTVFKNTDIAKDNKVFEI